MLQREGLTLREYRDAFTGLSELAGEFHIVLREDVKPVIQAHRRYPVAIAMCAESKTG